MRCPNHPNVELQWLTERNWFFRLSAYRTGCSRTTRRTPTGSSPSTAATRCSRFLRQGLEDISISRETLHWGIPFPIAENGETAEREDGSWDPEAGVIYVWFDALINYITGAGFPDDPEAFAKWWPADLHVIGKDINRFHTIIWPAMLMSAGIELPRKVWVHGWLLAPGGERMSKSRGNFLDPTDVVAALGADGARYVDAARGRRSTATREVSWDCFVRRYNADLANDFGNLVNRTVTMADALPRRRSPGARSGRARWRASGRRRSTRTVRSSTRFLLHDALAALWGLVGDANRFVDGEQPWAIAKAAKGGDEAAARRLRAGPGRPARGVPPIALAAAPFLPATAPRVFEQLGLRVPLRARRQRRPAAPRRAPLGCARGRGRAPGNPRAAVSAPRSSPRAC